MKITLHRARRPCACFHQATAIGFSGFSADLLVSTSTAAPAMLPLTPLSALPLGWGTERCFPAIKIRWLNLQMEQFLIPEFLVFCQCFLISRHALCRGCACKKHAANEMQESCLSRNKTVSKHTSKQQPLNIWLINYPKSVVPVPSLSP